MKKIANQRKDFLHKLSRKITNSYDVVCIEDLNMQGLSKVLNFGKSVHDNGWGIFTTYLSYKLEEEGKRLIKIYKCNCGLELDRDINAAINIKRQGLLLA